MFKKLLLILALISIVILTGYGALSGTYTTNSIFYRPGYGSYGLEEYNAYNAAMEVADNAIKDNQVAFGSYYLKTEIDTLGEVETIWVKDITDSDELATALIDYYLKTAIDSQGEMETIWAVSLENETHASEHAVSGVDTVFPADPNADKYLMWDDAPTGELIWTEISGGYTNLTSFVDQTAWRLFYSDSLGDVIELALGVDGTYLKSTGAASAPTFDTPTGAGDMLKTTYDTDEDGDIDVAAGGTEKSSWTLYAIPYLSGTTAFGEIPIGTAEYCLTVAAGATGYDWTLFDLSLYYLKTEIDTQGELETIWGDTLMNDLVDDTTPQLGGDLDAQANHIGFTQQTITYNVTTTTVDWGAGNKATVTLTGNVGTMAFTNPAKPSNLLLKIVQDGTGSRVVTAWDADIKWAGGTAPTLTTTADGIDICSFYWDGTNYFGVASLAFATP